MVTKWLINLLSASMRAPAGGIQGWMAKKIMRNANFPSAVEGIRRLELKETDTFVEIGAGHGAGLRSLADGRHIPQRIVCVELSPDFREILETVKDSLEYADRIEIYPDDCIRMPFLDDGSVDKIFALNVVYFLDPLDKYLKEIKRVLKPDGGKVCFGCKFGGVSDAKGMFVNTNENLIVDNLRAAGFEVTSSFVELEHLGSPMYSFTEITGTLKS